MTHKQLVFCLEYLQNGFNATQAAITAGYSKKTAYSIGQENLKKPEIQAYLKQFKDGIMEKAEITLERTIAEIARVAFSNIANVLKGKKISDLPEDVQAAISEINVVESKYGKRRTIKMHSKIQALDMLMRHFGGYVSVKDIIDKMDEEMANQIISQLMDKLNPAE